MSSIVTALGGRSPYPPLTLLPPDALAGARHVVLLVVDGLGLEYLSSRDGSLRRHLSGQLTSVFPSTTASAIPTFLTGLAPQQHGLTGWNMYFREIGAVVAPLPFRVRTGRHALRDAGVSPATLFGLTPLFDCLPLPCHVVSPQQIVHSDFNVALSERAQRWKSSRAIRLMRLKRTCRRGSRSNGPARSRAGCGSARVACRSTPRRVRPLAASSSRSRRSGTARR